MARKAITIEDRVREFCKTAPIESIKGIKAICDDAIYFRPDIGLSSEPVQKRQRKAKEAPQAKPAVVGDGQ